MLLEESDRQWAQFKHADVTCWNCEEKGHISRNCKKPKKSKTKDDSGKQGGNGKAGGSGSGNANMAEKLKGDEEEGAWAAEEEELDWFDEVVEAMEGEGKKDARSKILGIHLERPLLSLKLLNRAEPQSSMTLGAPTTFLPTAIDSKTSSKPLLDPSKLQTNKCSALSARGTWSLTYQTVIPSRNCDSWTFSTPQTLHTHWCQLEGLTKKALQPHSVMASASFVDQMRKRWER